MKKSVISIMFILLYGYCFQSFLNGMHESLTIQEYETQYDQFCNRINTELAQECVSFEITCDNSSAIICHIGQGLGAIKDEQLKNLYSEKIKKIFDFLGAFQKLQKKTIKKIVILNSTNSAMLNASIGQYIAICNQYDRTFTNFKEQFGVALITFN